MISNFQVSTAIAAVKRVLDNTRNPQYPADVAHAYDDKYLLAEFAVKAGVMCHLNALEAVTGSGWNEKLTQMLGWAATRSVTLRFFAEEKCAFDRTEARLPILSHILCAESSTVSALDSWVKM